MYKDARAKLFRGGQDFKHLSIIKIHTIDVGSDLDAAQLQIFHAPFKLFDCQRGILHRECAQSCKAPGMRLRHLSQVVIEQAGKVISMLRLGPI